MTTEFAAGDPPPTTNPHDPTRTPGGSSSGSAAAVAAGMVPAALGTQVAGSVIRPAGFCGTYAIKPTLGAINRGEFLHLSQDHVGVFASSLADLWNVTTEIASRAGGDPGSPGLFFSPDPARQLEQLVPGRVAVMETPGWPLTHPRARAAFEAVLDELSHHGVAVLRRGDHAVVERFETAIAAPELTARILGFESRWFLGEIDERYPGALSSSNRRLLDRGRAVTRDDYRAALAQRDDARRCLAALAPVADALISPTTTGPAPPLDTGERVGDATLWTGNPAFNAPASMLGTPAIALPMMAVDGLPVGIQLVGQCHADEELARIAAWIMSHVPPVTLNE